MRTGFFRYGNESGDTAGAFAPDLPGDLFHIVEIRQAPVFIVRALHDLERNPYGIIHARADDNSFAFGVALDDSRMRTCVTARFIAYRRTTVNFSQAHILISNVSVAALQTARWQRWDAKFILRL